MPVKTPELEEPVYQPQQMAAPPMPTGQQAQPLPPQAGYVSKAGAGAYIANSVLQGWLKGREINAQRNLQKAQSEMGYWDRTVREKVNQANQARMMTYQLPATLPDGKPNPDYLKAKAVAERAASDASHAYQGSLAAQAKYMAPAPGGEKKKGGGKGGEKGKEPSIWAKITGQMNPQMIPQAALTLAQQSAQQGQVPGMGPTPQEMEWRDNLARQTAADKEAEDKKAQQKVLDQNAENLKEAQGTDPVNRTPQQMELVAADWNAKYEAMKTVDPKKAAEMKIQQLMDAGLAKQITPDMWEAAGRTPKIAAKPEGFTLTGSGEEARWEKQPDGTWKQVAREWKEPPEREGKEEAKEAKRAAAAQKAVSNAVNLIATSGLKLGGSDKSPAEVEKIVKFYFEPDKTATGKTKGWTIRAGSSESGLPNPYMASELNTAVRDRLKKGPPPRTEEEVTEMLELAGVGQKPGVREMKPLPAAKEGGQANEFGFVPAK